MDFKSMFANNEHLSPQSHKPEHSHQWHTPIITGHVVFHHRSGSVEHNMSRMSRLSEKVEVNCWHSEKKTPDHTAVKNTPFIMLYLQPLKIKQLEVPLPNPEVMFVEVSLEWNILCKICYLCV